MKYKEQKEKLTSIIQIIGDCLRDDNFTNDEKKEFFEMTSKLLAMLMCL